jgi:biotin transport system substrate-specific component
MPTPSRPIAASLAESAFGPRLASIPFQIGLVIVGTLLLYASAKVSIPFYPVPLTLQPLAVLLIGACVGPRLGAITVIAYLAEGAIGLPVFAGTPEKGIGLAYMMGPTGGFLIGFVIAAWLVGALARRGWDRTVPTMALAMALGMAAIYLPGLLWLGTLLGWDKPILQWGFYPFIYGDLIKIAFAALLLPSLWKLKA